ncbi:MAG: 30S ribosomal protein S8, partial [Betaproteobacteria bacterium]|nr:30S ribosomal protein S8 [Betaproteobacteria bacterium]
MLDTSIRKVPNIALASSKLKVAIAQVLKEEGYIEGFQVAHEGAKSQL